MNFELVRFWSQKLKSQGHGKIKYGQKGAGNSEVHRFEGQGCRQPFLWRHTSQWFAIEDHLVIWCTVNVLWRQCAVTGAWLYRAVPVYCAAVGDTSRDLLQHGTYSVRSALDGGTQCFAVPQNYDAKSSVIRRCCSSRSAASMTCVISTSRSFVQLHHHFTVAVIVSSPRLILTSGTEALMLMQTQGTFAFCFYSVC